MVILFGWIACKWYFVCVGLRGKILRSVVGAVPMCPPVSPHKGASIVKFPTHNACILLWKRRCADVWAGTQAPPLRFRLGGLRVNGHFICVGLRGKILRSVVGAVPVCPPVSPCEGASIVKFPTHNAVYFWYENAAARTFGRARRHRPYGFVWVDCV